MPNLPRCELFSLDPYRGGPERKVTFYPLGRKLSAGSGEEFLLTGIETLSLRSAPPARPGPYSLGKFYFANYAKLPLYAGKSAAERGDWKEAVRWFERALAIAPYLIVAKENLCLALERNGAENAAAGCARELEAMKRLEARYL